jgi:hypothetical protein
MARMMESNAVALIPKLVWSVRRCTWSMAMLCCVGFSRSNLLSRYRGIVLYVIDIFWKCLSMAAALNQREILLYRWHETQYNSFTMHHFFCTMIVQHGPGRSVSTPGKDHGHHIQ